MEDSVEEGQSLNTCSQNITDVIKNNRACVGIKGERWLNVNITSVLNCSHPSTPLMNVLQTAQHAVHIPRCSSFTPESSSPRSCSLLLL